MRSTHRLPLLLSAGIAGLLLTAMPLGFDGSSFEPVATQAWAGENGNGHGNGNANGHDKDKKEKKENHGSTASKLGALNAAHASDTALANASPNSRVGKIAAYKEAELAAQEAAAAVEGAQDTADAAQAAADAEQAEADALAATPDTDGDGVTSPAELDAVAAAQAEADAAQDAADAAQDAADTAVADAEAAQDEADAALVNAANKDITDDEGNVLTDVRDAVNDLLGID